MDSAIKLSEKSKSNTKNAKPTIFVPGIGGSILQAKLNKTKEVDYFCYLKTSYYYRIWLNLEDLVPGAMDCFIDNMILLWNEKEKKWVNNTGVDMIPVPGNAGCDYLDPYDEFTRDETLYFGLMTQAFEAAGYVREKNLTALTYDFRLSPNEQSHYFDNMKSTIEKFYNNSNGTRVLLVSHSMGCMMTLYFLNSMTQDWKDKFVDSWIPIAGPFTGATVSLKSVISGYNLGINLIPDDKALIFNRAQSSGYWLFPTYYWGKDKVFVTTPKRNYTIDDMHQLFVDANISSLYPYYLYPRNLTDALVQPNVKVLCMYGYNISTDYGYVYDAQFSNPVSIPGDGDGTVPSLSATKCEMWKSQQDQPVELIGIPNVPHMYLVTDQTVIKFILSEALNV